MHWPLRAFLAVCSEDLISVNAVRRTNEMPTANGWRQFTQRPVKFTGKIRVHFGEDPYCLFRRFEISDLPWSLLPLSSPSE